MNKNFTKHLVFISILIFLFIMGFAVYKSYDTNYVKGNEKEINNYYNFEFLFNNGYIKVADNITGLNEKDDFYMSLDSENIMHIKYKFDDKVLNKEILGLPKGNLRVYYNMLSLNCLEVAALKGKNLYYNNFCLNDKKLKDFEMISTEVLDVYTPSVDKEGVYVINNNSITSNFIINTTLNEIKYISSKDKILGLYNNIETAKPYFNYICFDKGINICKNTMLYLDFNNELLYNYNLEQKVTSNSKKLIVQDIFGTFEINTTKDINYDNLNFNKLNKYEYSFIIYVLDNKNDLYILEISKKDILNKEVKNAFKYKNQKVSKIDYKKESDEIEKVIVTFADGSNLEINKENNKKIITSTLIMKNSIKSGVPTGS